MRKLIAILSVLLMTGCAFALAADNSVSDSAGTTNSMNQPGSAADNSMSETTKTTTEAVKTAKNAKSCVDESGITLKKGEKGFNDCLKYQKSKQESGTMGSGTTDTAPKSDTSMNQGADKPADPNAQNTQSYPSGQTGASTDGSAPQQQQPSS